MFCDTITLFNFREDSHIWYPTVINNVDISDVRAGNNTQNSVTNGDTAEFLINCKADKSIKASVGIKRYLPPKAYASCERPAECFTLCPENDFIYIGIYPDLNPISDDNDESGLYHVMNDKYDGVYLVTSAAYYSLIPHFEVGGK